MDLDKISKMVKNWPNDLLDRYELEEELKITDKLLESQYLVIDAIPECPAHGRRCIPHALKWIEKAKLKMKATDYEM